MADNAFQFMGGFAKEIDHGNVIEDAEMPLNPDREVRQGRVSIKGHLTYFGQASRALACPRWRSSIHGVWWPRTIRTIDKDWWGWPLLGAGSVRHQRCQSFSKGGFTRKNASFAILETP